MSLLIHATVTVTGEPAARSACEARLRRAALSRGSVVEEGAQRLSRNQPTQESEEVSR